MTEASGGLLESILQMPARFAEIAAGSPEQAILLALGALITAGASVVFGVVSIGGLAAAVGRLFPSGGQPPEGHR